MRALRCSSQVHSCSRFSSGWRQTNASTRSACSPTIRLQTVLSFFVPGRSTSQRPGRGVLVRQVAVAQRLLDDRVELATTVARSSGDLDARQRRAAGRGRARRAGRGGAGHVLGGRGVDRDAGRRRCGPRRTARRAGGRRRTSSSRRARTARTAARVVARVVAVDQHAGDAVADRGEQAADGGRDDRRAAGLRLERDQAERLVVAGDDGDVGGAVVVGEPLGRLRRDEPRRRRRCRARRPASAAARGASRPEPLGPPTTGTRSRRAQRRVARPAAAAAARSSTSGALSGWIRPTNSSTTASCGQADARGGRRRGRRAEPVEVDAGRDDLRPGPGRRRTGRPAGGPRRRCWRSAGRPRRRPAPRR